MDTRENLTVWPLCPSCPLRCFKHCDEKLKISFVAGLSRLCGSKREFCTRFERHNRLRRARRACEGAEWGAGAPRATEPGSGAEPRLVGRAALPALVFSTIVLHLTLIPTANDAGRMAAAQRPARMPDIYFAPTRQVIVDAMLQLARVTPDDVVYDLGSGDGRIVVIAAQKYGARGIGVELEPRLVEISRQVAREAGVADRVAFIEGDLFTADISDATVVALYLSNSINAQLEPKLRRELRPGTRIVSHQFRIGNWPPQQTVRVENEELFLWTIPPP